MTLDDIETPAVLINQDIALENIRAYQAYSDKHGFDLRPHIKTHKLPLFAHEQIKAGAKGITCQKISEAEVMAAAGVSDILITYNIIGESKLKRLKTLAKKLNKLGVVADNEFVLEGLSNAFADEPTPLDVMIECDTGGKRCGVQSPEAALKLAIRAHDLPGLSFRGLMTYPGVNCLQRVEEFITETLELLKQNDIDCPVVSSGGSPDMWQAHTAPVVTEYRVGTYIYNDRSLVERGTCDWDVCAMTILTTVVSVPTQGRAIIDAGSKTLTSDLIGLENYGYVVGRPDLKVSGLSEEHGIIELTDGTELNLAPGDRLQIIPNHCCVVSNMVNQVVMHNSGTDFKIETVEARGCLT